MTMTAMPMTAVPAMTTMTAVPTMTAVAMTAMTGECG
jgi:hypothetical protein